MAIWCTNVRGRRPTRNLLERGEDSHLEYKPTLRWDIVKAEKSVIEGASLKTVAAFLNSRYGKKRSFFIRLNNGTKAIADELEIQRYVSQRWTS